MGIEISQTLSEDTWRFFIEQHPEGNIFQTPEMFNVFKNARGYEPCIWAAINSHREPLAIFLPVNIALSNGLFHNLTKRTVSFGSVLCVSRTEGCDALNLLLKTYKHNASKGSLFTELRNLSDLSRIQPILQNQGFNFDPHLDFQINLRRPVEELKRNMDREVMTNVRRAQKKGVIIEEITSLEKLPAVYAVLQNVFKRIEVPLASITLFESAFQILYPKQMIKILAASVDGAIIGIAIRLLYKDNIFAWYAGALRNYATFKAHDFLNWYILEWGAQNGFGSFDFGGAGRPYQTYGPRNYKAKFGGNLVNFGRNTFIHAPMRLKASSFVYKLYRKTL